MRRGRSANDATNLSRLAERALEVAAQRNASIVTAKSCTAGKLAALLSEAPGAAERLHGSFVTYTKANKTKSLGVSAALLQRKGAKTVHLERRYDDLGRDAVQEHAMADALRALIDVVESDGDLDAASTD